MKILISTLLLPIAFLLNFVDFSSQGDTPRCPRARSRSPPRLELSLSLPGQSDNRPVSELNYGKTGASSSRTWTSRFRLRDALPPAVQGPPNGFVLCKGKRIEILLDFTGKKVLRADFTGNIVPSGNYYRYHNFICRLSVIGGLKMVEYIKQDGSLLGVRAPIQTNANVMEPNDTQWFIIYCRRCFRVRTNLVTKVPVGISLASQNEDEVVHGKRAEEVVMDGFKFVVFRGGPIEDITGVTLL